MATRKTVTNKPRAKKPTARPRRPKGLASTPGVPDEFSAMGGMPVVSLPGLDRSVGQRPVRDLSWSEFDRQVQALARDVHRTFKPDAVVGVGYDDAKQWFIVRNSWGNQWGLKGYFTLPYAYVTDENLASDFWTIRIVQ